MLDVSNVSEEHKALLMWDRVETGDISEEVFAGNLELVQNNADYVSVLEGLRDTSPGVYTAILRGGAASLASVVGMLVQSGVVDKKTVRDECKMKKGPAKELAWFKSIFKELAPVGHAAMETHYAENFEAYAEKYGEVVPESFMDFFVASGSSTLSYKVGVHPDHPVTGKDCALAVTYRIDFNNKGRNKKKEETPTNGA